MLIVHTNVLTPVVNPVTPEAGEPGAVSVALPTITDQTPAPTVGVLPARVAVSAQTV